MNRLQGKIISIPVKEVTEGMQVVWSDSNGIAILVLKVCKTSDERGGKQIGLTKDGKYAVNIMYCDISELRTLVVEYNTETNPLAKRPMFVQIPLKYKQWESAIENEEVYTDKVIEFEILVSTCNKCMLVEGMHESPDCCGKYISYAKIIPQRDSKTKLHLQWIYNHMINLHKENKNYDYMIKFKEIIDLL